MVKTGGLGTGKTKRVRQITGGAGAAGTKSSKPGKPALKEPHTLKNFNLADSQIVRFEAYLTAQKEAGVKGRNMTVVVRELIEDFLTKEGF